MHPDIWFYNLNIYFYNVPRIAFSIFGLEIFWYGIIITIAVTCGYIIAILEAKRTEQDTDLYSDLILWVVPAGAIGARLYYIIFAPNQSLLDFFNFRGGGLAIYGLIIGALPIALLFCKVKKVNKWVIMDTAVFGLIIGQIIGRWGNFINREAFGGYTNNIFALRYRVDQLSYLPQELVETIINVDGIQYIQVHPTFLYESMLNLSLFGFMNFYKTRKTFNGEIFMVYLIGYGTIRAFLETLRTDSLMIGPFRTSVLVSIIIIIAGIYGMYYNKKKSLS